MFKLILPPDQTSYAAVDGTEVLSTSLDGGSARYRKDVLNSTTSITAKWTLDREGFNYFRIFYKDMINSGADAFLLDLYVDDPFELTEHECHIVPGSFGLTAQSGLSFTVGATLEVKPIAQSQANKDLAYIYSYFGANWTTEVDTIDKLINIDIPADF